VRDVSIWTFTHWGFAAWAAVGKGIKWLSNLNLRLSFCVLAFFVIFGATLLGLQALFLGVWDYLLSIPGNIFAVWSKDGTPVGDALAGWQGGWSICYWAWWIASAPFVGLFLAHISRGRTVHNGIALDRLFAQPLTIQLHSC
jgi:choline/glycine/proline betaine transport protein